MGKDKKNTKELLDKYIDTRHKSDNLIMKMLDEIIKKVAEHDKIYFGVKDLLDRRIKKLDRKLVDLDMKIKELDEYKAKLDNRLAEIDKLQKELRNKIDSSYIEDEISKLPTVEHKDLNQVFTSRAKRD